MTKPSSVGSFASNFHEGGRTEYLAQYIFAAFGTAVLIPRQEDHGIDLLCSLAKRDGKLSWVEFPYTVQIKSTKSPWIFPSVESVRWLVQHPLPLFLAILDKSSARLSLYHTFPRFQTWVNSPSLPEQLHLVPGTVGDEAAKTWEDGTTFSLGAPILEFELQELLHDEKFDAYENALRMWLKKETQNLACIATDI